MRSQPASISTSAVVKLHDADGAFELLETTENLIVPESQHDWADHWQRNDLWVERTVNHGLSQIVTGDDLITSDEMKHTAFYNEWLHRLEIHHVVGAAFAVGDERVGILGIHRPLDGAHYAEFERRRVGFLLPHLQRALKLSRRLSGVSLAQSAALDALDHVDAGILVVDSSRRIVYANALAEAMLRDEAELGALGGRLVLKQPALDARFADIIRDTLAIGQGRLVGARPPLSLLRDEHLPITLTVTLLRPRWSRCDGQPPLALIFLRDPERVVADIEKLRGLFGLTAAEAVIAADLAKGLSLDRIAQAHGVAIATVRSHLKKILAKSGTSRQAELVALIAMSIAPMIG